MTSADRCLLAMFNVEMRLYRVTPEWWLSHPDEWRSFLEAVATAWIAAASLDVTAETLAAVANAKPDDPTTWPEVPE